MDVPRHLCISGCAFILGALVLLGLEPDQPLPVMAPFAPISTMVNAVQAARLKTTVDRLVAFGTRNDFSETSSNRNHGVFGARDWIAAQLSAIAANTNGRMS